MKKFFYKAIARVVMLAVASGVLSSLVAESRAGVITPPTAEDTFYSSFNIGMRLMPAYTSLPLEVCVGASGNDFVGTKAHVLRELNAFNGFYGTDTVNTSFKSMHLAGFVDCGFAPFLGKPVQFKVGANNGFLPGLGESKGQVAEVPSTPTNGQLDVFPAKSVFDLFIDVWVDINTDNIVDNGEVLRNFDYAARLVNNTLTGFPPTEFVDSYTVTGKVWKDDPLLGEFGATVLPLPIDFYVVNPDGTNSGLLAARIGDCPDCGTDVHTITPEPSSLAAFAGLFGVFFRRRALAWVKRGPQPQSA
jgi:hypothetical protein